MHMDPIMLPLVGAIFTILFVGLVTHRLKQPSVVGYLLVGVLLGPHVFGLITDEITLERLGDIGVILLLFFVGMEVCISRLISGWRIAVIGTLFQILMSIACVWLVGMWFDWPLAQRVLLGFVVSLSSTAVIIKFLEDQKAINTEIGQDALGILLVQDMAIVPMLIAIDFMGGKTIHPLEIGFQILGGIGIIGLLIWLSTRQTIRFPLPKVILEDHELQVFMALMLCFGIALLTGLLNLSTALGAFVAGIVVGMTHETNWVHDKLEPFRVVFVALFFVSIGMLIDLKFLIENWLVISSLVGIAFITNTFINACILRILGINWRRSLYTGALLSQIGEFSFVLAAVGFQAQIITLFGYKLTILVISLTLLLGPIWAMFFKVKVCEQP